MRSFSTNVVFVFSGFLLVFIVQRQMLSVIYRNEDNGAIKTSYPVLKQLTQPTQRYNESSYRQVVLDAVKNIQKKPVMVSLINGGYLELAFNWLCNTKYMGIHDQVSKTSHTGPLILNIWKITIM